MDFRFNENEQMLVDLLGRFAREELAAAGAEADREGACPPELIAKATELGLFLDAIPEAHGGFLEGAYDFTARTVRVMTLARGCPALTLRFEANTEYALAAAQMGEAAAATLADLADPTKALAATVLAQGHQPLTLENGRISGHVGAVPNVVGAKYLLVVADDETARPEHRWFVGVVRGGAPGVRIEPAKPMGLRATAVGDVVLEDAEPLALLTDEAARPIVELVRNSMRILAGALGVGAAQQAIDYAEAYAAERIQFGQPIGRFESLARLMEENRARLEAAAYLLYAAAQGLDHGEDGVTRRARYAASFAGEAAVAAAIDAVQIYGGYGFVNDYPVEKIMRDTRAMTTLAGDGLREQVFTHLA